MADPTDVLHTQLQLLRSAYTSQLQEKVDAIKGLWGRLSSGPWNSEDLRTMHRLTNTLASSSATFGLNSLSIAARTLEQHLKNIVDGAMQPSEIQRRQIADDLTALQLATAASETPVAPDGVNTKDEPPAESSVEENRLIFVVEDDALQAQDLALQIGHFGYTVRTFTRLKELEQAVQEKSPVAIIMDIKLPEGNSTDLITAIQHSRKQPIPVMFIADQGDVLTRLQAVRGGGNAYFTKPIDIGALIDKLDKLTEHQEHDPYRILIVDDSPVLSSYCAFTLQQADMVTAVVTNPLQVMHSLSEFRPDLILMDVHMPGCSGLELAAVLRQQEAYVSIPIVFLSGETSLDKQMAALRYGGDDFLTKPIQPDHLISSVTARVLRSRTLRSLMVRDGLTNLLNHTTTKAQLEIEVARAMRQRTELSLAIIDIDRFKSINDTYGHATGDRVIKSLSRLLMQRLRKTDVIGRYGGEEFAVILPNTDGMTAVKVIDQIRMGFAHIRQLSDTVSFSVTFSCGVASLSSYEDAARLNDAADKALYEAKRGGRNRVVLAQDVEWTDSDDQLAELSQTSYSSEPQRSVARSTSDREASGPPASSFVPNVLLVDSDPDVNGLLQGWLETRNYHVEIASKGEEALDRLASAAHDIVFLDIMMPGIDSLAALEGIRSRRQDVAVIMTMAFGAEQFAIDALRRGADDYLRKPIEVREFLAVLDRTVGRLQLSRQNAVLRRQLHEKHRQLETELGRAAQLQADLLPRIYPDMAGFELAARCLSAREIGGDFYDWQMQEEGALTLTVGDVMGKGMPAALLMMTARATIRAVLNNTIPANVVQQARRTLQSDLERSGSFIALFHARLDIATRQLRYVDAGHAHSFVRRASGTVEELRPRGLPLGVPGDEVYRDSVLFLNSGDMLVVYSDGLIGARPDLKLDRLRLAQQIEQADTAQCAVDKLIELAVAGTPDDDLTVVVLRCTSADAPKKPSVSA